MKQLLQTFFLICSGIVISHAQTLVGVTQVGGTNGGGTVTKFVVESNELTLPLSFDGEGASPSSNGGKPAGKLVQAINGKLYGLTNVGGSEDLGTLYSVDPEISTITKVHDFTTADGTYPIDYLTYLIQATDGKLYGIAPRGGLNDYGTIFSFDPATGVFTKLRDMDFENGGNPTGALLQAADGKLYGVNNSGLGSIFSFDPVSSTYTKLKDFDGTNGQFPSGTLIQGNDGKLYGLTHNGGSLNVGVLFSYELVSNTLTNLKSFDATDGANPVDKLVQANNGLLYGVTNEGGSRNVGVLFAFNPTNSVFTKLQDFVWTNGANPTSGLMQASNGKLYGTTITGGSTVTDADIFGAGAGVIYSYDPATATFNWEKDFDGTIGARPGGELVEVSGCTTPITYYQDSDADGFGNPGQKLLSCSAPEGYVTDSTDCNDNDNNVHVSSKYFRDNDNDGYGNSTDSLIACSQPDGYVTDNTDCDDNNIDAHLALKFYRDADGDGFGNPEDTIMSCTMPDGYVNDHTDCDDTDKRSQAASTYYRDADHDGFGDGTVFLMVCGKAPRGYVKNNFDCDDHSRSHRFWGIELKMCRNGKTDCVSLWEVFWRLRCGWTFGPCNNIESRTITAVPGSENAKPKMARENSLSHYPNPFRGNSTIRYQLASDSRVSIKVYDVLGRAVTTLVDEYKKAGAYSVNFNAGRIGSGALYYRIIANSKEGRFEQTNKMMLVR